MLDSPNDCIRHTLEQLRCRLQREDPWPFLSDAVPDQLGLRGANWFLLGASLQYQMVAELAWENARRLLHLLGHPDDPWKAIASLPEQQFVGWFESQRFHRYKRRAGARTHRVARAMIRDFQGDARCIWRGRTDAAVRASLLKLFGGHQIPEMIMNALLETGHVVGRAQIKLDVHTKRVLGRLFSGREFAEDEAADAASRLFPQNPSLADRGLWFVGREHCHASAPDCRSCPLEPACVYPSATRIPEPND